MKEYLNYLSHLDGEADREQVARFLQEKGFPLPEGPDIFQVGPDEPWDMEQLEKGVKWIVYHYTQGDYDGSGEAVGLRKDGKTLVHKDLGHCSCYGAAEGGWEDYKTVKEFLEDYDDAIKNDLCEPVATKVRELVSK